MGDLLFFSSRGQYVDAAGFYDGDDNKQCSTWPQRVSQLTQVAQLAFTTRNNNNNSALLAKNICQ